MDRYFPFSQRSKGPNKQALGFQQALMRELGMFMPAAQLPRAPGLAAPPNLSEVDFIHAPAADLPTFDGRLSAELGEQLLSVLTAPYLRVPLLLRFFAVQERVLWLAEPELAALFSASVFAPGPWSAERLPEDADEALAAALAGEDGWVRDLASVPAAAVPSNVGLAATVGSPEGSLLNELRAAPDGVLRPVLDLLRLAVHQHAAVWAAAPAAGAGTGAG